MQGPVGRRRFLTIGSSLAASATFASIGGGTAQSIDSPDDFHPAQNGFGFRNWTSEDTFADIALPEIPEETIADTVREEWREPVRVSFGLSIESFPDLLISVISRQIYTSVNQLSGTNGHCYGMVFAAQRYFEDPGTIPLDREIASDITHPAEPIDDPDHNPILDEIEWFHQRQFTDFHSWLGRRAAFRPDWIDYEEQLTDLTAVLDDFGTAGISLIDTSDYAQHQVLVYDYEESAAQTILYAYDPNRAAHRYRSESGLSRIVVDWTSDRASIVPYGRGYNHFVFNRFDRIVRVRAEEAGALDRFTAGVDEIRSVLFTVTLFLLASPTVSIVVVGPDGRPLVRDTATYMDTTNTEYDDIRYRYGAEPGVYRVALLGEDDGPYTLEAVAASIDGELLEERVTGDIGAGDVHRYEVTVPEEPADGGTIERVGSGDRNLSTWLAAAGGAGAVLAAGAGYRYATSRTTKPAP